MEFQYCDRCGDITQANHAKGNELLCANCAGQGSQQNPKAPPAGLDLLQDPTQELSNGTPLGEGELDFFSNDTLAMRREEQKPKSTSKLKLVDERPDSTATKKPGSAVLGTTQPLGQDRYAQRPDERWRVDCLHCAGSLSVRPANKRSKLRCPRCKGVMVLEPSGQVTSVGSTIVKRKDDSGSGAVHATGGHPGSSFAAKAPSPVATPPMPRATPTPPAPPAMAASATAPPMGAPAGEGSSPFGGSAESLAVYKDTFLGNTADAPESAAALGAPSPATAVAEPPFEPATAPIAGGGTEFAISPDSAVSNPAASLEEDGAYAGAGIPSMTRHATANPTDAPSTVGSFTAFAWMTVALLPCIAGLLMVHQASGDFGTSLLTELGNTVQTNASKVLDWCAQALGK